ncbi:MFS transporter [Kaistia granuli]|uniref:MFS transporter n=1 Tax=Kaistia granuli TaxID=363259 RepID=UPI000364D018|nr:MFS transporter [Kaistia granuli]
MDRPANRQARFFVALAIMVALLNSTAASPLYTSYRMMWSLDAFTVAFIFAIYAFGTLIALFLLGRLSDRLPDRRLLIILSLSIVVAGALIFGSADNLATLLIGRLLAGAGTGGLTGIANAALIELDPKADARANAVLATAVFTAGCAFGPVISSAALYFDAWPLHLPFLLIAALAIITVIGLATAGWQPAPRALPVMTAAAGSPAPAGRYTAFAVAAGAVIIAWAVGATFAGLGVTFVHELLKVESQAASGVIVAFFQLVAGISQLASQRVDSNRAMVWGTTLIALAILVCAYSIWASAPLFFVLGTVGSGIGYGAAFVGSAGIVNRIAPPDRRATWVSTYYFTAYLANALPVLALGFLGDQLGLFGAFLCLTAFTVCGTIIVNSTARIALRPASRRR